MTNSNLNLGYNEIRHSSNYAVRLKSYLNLISNCNVIILEELKVKPRLADQLNFSKFIIKISITNHPLF